MELSLRWYGPYSFLAGSDAPPVTAPGFPYRNAKGVYLWTVQGDGGYYLSYAGKTSRRDQGLTRRFQEHIDWTLEGNEGEVNDPVEFAKGCISTHAIFTPDQFRANRQLKQLAESVLRCVKVFVSPIDNLELIPFIEGVIIRKMRKTTTGKVFDFFANRKTPRQTSDLKVKFENSPCFHGLDDTLDCRVA